jgi:Fe2+ or Zn2+ uptake regulation protein
MAASGESDRRAQKKLADHLQQNGLKQTRQREAILEAFVAAKGHMTSEELYEVVRARHPEVGAATVYRALKLFCEAGIAKAHHFRAGVTLYAGTVCGPPLAAREPAPEVTMVSGAHAASASAMLPTPRT